MTRQHVRFGASLLTFAIFAFVLLLRFTYMEESTAQTPEPGGSPVAMPSQLEAVLISLGLKDETTTVWTGEVRVSNGKIVSLDIVQGNPKGSIKGGKFDLKSVIAKKMAKKDGITRPILRATLDAPPTARISISTNHGDFDVSLADLPAGTSKKFLQGSASVEREEAALRLTSGGFEFDYPAFAKDANGDLWLAYSEYQHGKPYVTERVLAGGFDELVPKGNGDRILLKKFDGKTWSPAFAVTEGGLDLWRPSITVAKGKIHVTWSQQVAGNWDVYHRVFTPPSKDGDSGQWSEIMRVSERPGTDYNAVSTTSSTGQVWVAWQSWEKTHFQVRARSLDMRPNESKPSLVGKEISLTSGAANHWNPAIAADSKGNIFVVFDDYAKENYDVRLAKVSSSGTVTTQDIATSAKFEARASLAVDKQDRVWIAFEVGDEQWGKDFSTNMFRKIGLDENPGNALYLTRTIDVKCVVDGEVRRTTGDLQKAIKARTANNRSLPRITVDDAGLPWVLYRHHPKPLGAGEVWNSYATRFDGEQWSAPTRLALSDNLMDNRPAVAPIPRSNTGGIVAVYSGDKRSKQQDRKRNDLYVSKVPGAALAKPIALIADVPVPAPAMKSVHPNEVADVARMREHRFEFEGKKLSLIRGEFHRHTEYTAHRDGDGLLEDSWRYALDAGRLDWMGNADHDNGQHDEYAWWQIQKFTDLMHNPPYFVAVHSYERSNVYPNGHRNVILPKRGIRCLPRGVLIGSEEKGTPDTKLLYQYLKYFGGMCSSHTSGTGMGTDWRDNDPVYEPVVEVYQGHRHNYEHFGAPRSPTQENQIGGYQPKGFIWNAFAKGYKLGFQASSDHISTHMSYGVVLTDDVSRQGIIDAFKRRHSYAATDNIILEVRCGKHLMGDIFEVSAPPTLEIKVLGTAPVTKIAIVRDEKYIHISEPKQKDVNLTFTDRDAEPGKTNYYYVRVEQSDANLAWASPMWITYKNK